MEAFKLRFADRARPDLDLAAGHYGVARTSDGGLGLVLSGDAPLVNFCVDRRGIWLTVGEGPHAVHVNGRPVRRMAMLRAGDAIYVDGTELLLAADAPGAGYTPGEGDAIDGDPRMVLRGIGGRHHGRSFTLERPRLVGSAAEADIRIDDPAFADRHARFELHEEGVVLRGLGSEDGSAVNGRSVHDALLRPGDQVVFDAQHRFVLEAPSRDPVANPIAEDENEASAPDARQAPGERLQATARRVPWLLLAAVLIAIALSALLLFGTPG